MTEERAGARLEPPSRRVWLLITRRGMWDQFRESGKWAFHHHSIPRAKNLAPGDLACVYLTKERGKLPSSLVALIEVVDRGSLEQPPNGVSSFYPFHVPFTYLTEVRPAVLFSEVVPSLEFVKRKERYGVFIQGKSAILLSCHDARVVAEAILKSNLTSLARKQLGNTLNATR